MKFSITRLREHAPYPPSPASLIAAGLLTFSILFLLVETIHQKPQLDDAYISYRYARNLAEGHGLVYNPGQRVEGFTNLLWTLLISGCIAAGTEAPVAGHWLGVFGGIATLLAAYIYARALLPQHLRFWACVPPLIIVASPYSAYWCTKGMETALFTAFITATLAAQARNAWRTTTLLAILMTLTRPDGILIAACVLAPAVLRAYHGERRLLTYPMVYAGALAAMTCARIIYYGDPLPNTFYAKQGGVENFEIGVLYLIGFLFTGAVFLFAPVRAGAKLNRDARPGAAAITLFIAYVVYEGGDFMIGARFLMPLLPALSAIAVAGVILTPADRPAYRAALTWCLLASVIWPMFGPAAAMPLAAMAFVPPMFMTSNRTIRAASGFAMAMSMVVLGFLLLSASETAVRYRDIAANKNHFAMLASRHQAYAQRAKAYRSKGERLRRLLPVDSVIATEGIGYVGYYSELDIIDILGLTDPVIARYRNVIPSDMMRLPGHLRSHPDHVLSLKPDYIFINQDGILPASVDLLDHPTFKAEYQWDNKIRGFARKVPNKSPSHE